MLTFFSPCATSNPVIPAPTIAMVGRVPKSSAPDMITILQR